MLEIKVKSQVQSNLASHSKHPYADQLIDAAKAAAARAYCPYSKFRVGAALLADGQLFSGCNIENSSYGLTLCAERVAIFNALSAGQRRIEVIAVVCVDAQNDAPKNVFMPCGACRQVMAEFAEPELEIIIDRVGSMRLSDVLPAPFRLL